MQKSSFFNLHSFQLTPAKKVTLKTEPPLGFFLVSVTCSTFPWKQRYFLPSLPI